MSELWLVRHGQTDWNSEKRYQGQTDIPLNDTGLAQAFELGKQLAGIRFNAVYSSDLQRARQTAIILAGHLGSPHYEDARLREAHFGNWEGECYPEIRERYPEIWVRRKLDPNEPVAPGGETLPQVVERMSRVADDIVTSFPGGRVLVVAHGLSLAVLLCKQQGKPLNEAYHFILDNAHPEVIEWSSSEQEITNL